MGLSGAFNLWKPVAVAALLAGLRDGLSRFSGPSRVALFLQLRPTDPISVYDSQGLLKEHRKALLAFYTRSQSAWRTIDASKSQALLKLDGVVHHSTLLVNNRTEEPEFYARLFAESHAPSSSGATLHWLAEALRQLFHQFVRLANGERFDEDDLYRIVSGHAPYAVADYIRTLRGPHLEPGRPAISVDRIIRCIAEVSMGVEEGHDPRGRLMFIDPEVDDVGTVAKLLSAEAPTLDRHKHIRKLLRISAGTHRALLADDRHIIGIATDAAPKTAIVADFRGRVGEIRVGGHHVCGFARGHFFSRTLQPDLRTLATALVACMDGAAHALSVIRRIVATAIDAGHGCSIVLDTQPLTQVSVSGHRLDPPLDLSSEDNIRTAAEMAGVDGALYLDSQARIRAFACLLDGPTIGTEDLSRGARYNSALRFVRANPNIYAIVVSEDGLVSTFGPGVALPQQWVDEGRFLESDPPTLRMWARHRDR